MSANRCQAQLHKVPFQKLSWFTFSYIEMLSRFESIWSPTSRASRISKSIFKTEIRGVQGCILGTFHTHRRKMWKGDFEEVYDPLCFLDCVCFFQGGEKKVIFEKMHIILSTRVLFLNLSIWTRSAGPQTVLYLLWQLKQHMVSKEQHSLAQLTSLLVNVQQVICYNCKKLVYIQNRLASITQSSLTVAITLCGKKYPTVILK